MTVNRHCCTPTADDEDDIDQDQELKSSSHALEINVYLKQGFVKSFEVNADGEDEHEFNPLSFWRKMHSSDPVLSKVAARVFAVPASSACCRRKTV